MSNDAKDRMAEVFGLIANERMRQDAKWGSDRHLDNMLWLTILAEEFGEVARAILENKGLFDELIQVAAVAVCWLEQMIPFENKNGERDA